MSFYCNSSIESIQSCACSCRTSCFYPCRPCCCCKKHVAKPLFKRRSRFGDIFKGQTPNLEDLNYYRKKKKSRKRDKTDNKGEKSKKIRSKGTKSNGKTGTGGKGTKRKKKGEKGTRPGGQKEIIVVGGDYDGRPLGDPDRSDPGRGKGGAAYGGGGKSGPKKGAAGYGGAPGGGFIGGGAGTGVGGAGNGVGGAGNGVGGAGTGGTGYGAPGTTEAGYTGASGAGYGGTGYGKGGQGGAGQAGVGYPTAATGGAGYAGIGHDGDGYGQGTDQGWQSGDGGAYGLNKTKWGRQNNECRPNQLVKCPQTCTLKPKKCMLNQIGPCHEACLKGIPYNEPKTINYLQMNLGNQPYTNIDNNLYCAHGGLKRNQNEAFNSVDPNTSWVAPPAHIQTTTSCPTYQNMQNIPQYCTPYATKHSNPQDQSLKNMLTYCGPQNHGPFFNSHQNFGNLSPNRSQYCSPQMHNGYGTMPYNLQSSEFNVNPLEVSCQPGGLQNFTNNPLYQQQNYFGIQQLPTINPSYGWPLQSSTSPKIEYIQGGDGIQPFCPAVRSVTCKLCGRERKFVQTLYVKPNVDTIFTTKDVKTKCSQTIA